jgi:glutathione S-transferase
MKLYHSTASPYVRKVMMTAWECALVSRIELLPASGTPAAPNREIAAHNPLMKMPTLIRDDGSELYDSIVICEYFDSLAGGTLFPPAGEARWQVLRRHALADGLLDSLLAVRYETVARPEPLRWQEWIDGHSAKIDNALDAFEREVDALPAAIQIDQIALVAVLGYLDFRFASRPWRPGRPKLGRWFARISERESAKRTAPA